MGTLRDFLLLASWTLEGDRRPASSQKHPKMQRSGELSFDFPSFWGGFPIRNVAKRTKKALKDVEEPSVEDSIIGGTCRDALPHFQPQIRSSTSLSRDATLAMGECPTVLC